MTAAATLTSAYRSLWLPGLLVAGLLGLIGVEIGIVRLPTAQAVELPETIILPSREFAYRLSGEFLRDGVPVDAPLAAVAAGTIEIMRYQVSLADYARCVDDGACERAEPRRRTEGDVPVTGVSFNDAEAYARWLGAQTGEGWRLPTDAEWAQIAGSRFADDALGIETDGRNPAERWLANYERETALGAGAIAALMPLGTFGSNEYGVTDLAGSVWEWTSTCNSRTRLDAANHVLSVVESCGVRILEGRHRTAMSTFVRDGRSGGCSVGAPPDNLGFRLVKERPWYAPLLELARWSPPHD